MKKKDYTSPLFEEIALMTEDVLTSSVGDNNGDGDEAGEWNPPTDDFDF